MGGELSDIRVLKREIIQDIYSSDHHCNVLGSGPSTGLMPYSHSRNILGQPHRLGTPNTPGRQMCSGVYPGSIDAGTDLHSIGLRFEKRFSLCAYGVSGWIIAKITGFASRSRQGSHLAAEGRKQHPCSITPSRFPANPGFASSLRAASRTMARTWSYRMILQAPEVSTKSKGDLFNISFPLHLRSPPFSVSTILPHT